MAASAPLRGLGADGVLHVLDRLSVPLVVERREMVSGTEPLVVDVLMAALAGIGFHKKLAGNLLASIDLRGAGEKWALWSITLFIHTRGRVGGVLDARVVFPARGAEIPCSGSQRPKKNQSEGGTGPDLSGL